MTIRKRLAAAALAALLLPAGAFADELAGTRWTLRWAGLLQLILFWNTDTLEFEAGRFLSDMALHRGFHAAAYVGDSTWSAVQKSKSGEKLEWQGNRSGDRMAGTLAWTKPFGKKKVYRWKAKLKK